MLKFLKKYTPKSLLWRVMLILILPTLIAQGIIVFIFYDRHVDNVSRHLAYSLAGEVTTITEYIESAGSSTSEQNYLSRAQNLFAFSPKLMSKESAAKHVTGLERTTLRFYNRSLSGRLKKDFSVYTDNDKVVTTLVNLSNSVLVVDVPYKRLVNSTSYIFLLWMTGITTLLLIVSLIFLKNQIRPVIRLARMADNFGRGQEVLPDTEFEGANEVRQAYKAFYNMSERISRFIKQRTEMLTGISHDLRTPLTRMKLELALAKDEALATGLNEDIEELEHMIDSYIDFIRGDEGEEANNFSLTEMVQQEAEKYKNSNITIKSPEKITITAKSTAIKRVVKNLLDNAVKYASTIEIKIVKQAGYALIELEDNGPGIPPEKYEDVFKPFYRLDESRNTKTGGSGLGLSIVKDIVTSHGGYISLTKSQLGGLKVQLYLPL